MQRCENESRSSRRDLQGKLQQLQERSKNHHTRIEVSAFIRQKVIYDVNEDALQDKIGFEDFIQTNNLSIFLSGGKIGYVIEKVKS